MFGRPVPQNAVYRRGASSTSSSNGQAQAVFPQQDKSKEKSKIPVFSSKVETRSSKNKNNASTWGSNRQYQQHHSQSNSSNPGDVFQPQQLKKGEVTGGDVKGYHGQENKKSETKHNYFSKAIQYINHPHHLLPSTTILPTKIDQKTGASFRAPSNECFEFLLSKIYSKPLEERSVLQAQLTAMIERSTMENLEAHPNTYRALSRSTVDLITSFCDTLEVNIPTVYRAIELYDRFVIRFNDEIWESTKRMDTSEKDAVRLRIQAQGALRMCTCILLASKLHSDTQTPSVTTGKIKDILMKRSNCFKKEAVVKSEMRVMMTLNFRLHWVTPFELVEHMLSLLNLTRDTLPHVYHYCMLLLEFFYQSHQEIYKRLWAVTFPDKSAEISEEDKDMFKHRLEFNSPLRSASIVVCALFVVKPDTPRRFSKELAEITLISEEDINQLSLLLLNLVLS